MNAQQTHWEVIAGFLRQARDELQSAETRGGESPSSGLPDEAAAQFEMFLESNELELAWDALAAIADETTTARSVWEKLLLAAGLMSLAGQAHLAATRLCSPNVPAERAS